METQKDSPTSSPFKARERGCLPPKAERDALRLLLHVEAELGRVLAHAGGEVDGEGAGGDALAHQLLMLILRRRATLDWLLRQVCARPPEDTIRRILWWALAEALYLDGLPLPVVVDTAVEAAKAGGRSAGAFVNAVLRRLLAPGRAAVLARVQAEAPPWVSLDLGEALYAAWSRRFTAAALAELAARLQEPAPVVVRRRAGADLAGAAGLEPCATPAWAGASELWRCRDARAFFASPAWQRRAFYVQDPSTLLAPALVAAAPGEQVVDLCGAPGGKTLLLSEAVGAAGRVVCVDRSARRLQRVRENLGEVAHVSLLVADAREVPLAAAAFDAVLADVPCSNTGVVRRRPDVRWHFSAAGRDDLARRQAQILAAAARLVRPGGRLVYSTCSLEPEEDGDVVRAFLARHPDYGLDEERLLLPGREHDGAYAARLRRARAPGPSPRR